MKNLSKEDKRKIVEAQSGSGKSASEFCREVGIPQSTFAGYKRAVRGEFALVQTGDRIALELSNGREIKVNRVNLKEVLEVLSE